MNKARIKEDSLEPWMIDAKGVLVDARNGVMIYKRKLERKKRYERKQIALYNALFKKKIEIDGVHPDDA